MAGNEIIVRLKNESSESFGSGGVQETEQKAEQQKNKANPKSIAIAAAQQVAIEAMSYVVNEAMYQINRNFQLNDDYIQQREMMAAMTVISKTANIATSTIGAAVSGFAVGGIWGAAIAGSIALTSGILKTEQETRHAMEQQEIKLRQMNASLNFSRQRSGFALTSGSIGENR